MAVEVVVEVGQLAGGLGRGDDEAVDDVGERPRTPTRWATAVTLDDGDGGIASGRRATGDTSTKPETRASTASTQVAGTTTLSSV